MGRLPTGLLFSLVIAGLCLAVLWGAAQFNRDGHMLELLVHGSAALCLVWSVVGFVISWRASKFAQTQTGRDLRAVLEIASIVTGLMVVILMTFAAVTEVIFRTHMLVEDPGLQVRIWPTGLLDLACVAGATILAWAFRREPQLVTVCFWILLLAGLWLTLGVPAEVPVHTGSGWSYHEMTSWAVPFLVWNSLLIVAFSAGDSLRYRVRMARAWPDRLDDLIRRRRPWPGFQYSVGIIAVVQLLIACIHITSPWTGPAAVLTAIALLTMVDRRWDESLADVALGLLTVGVISLPVAWLPMPHWPSTDFYLEVFNRLIFGLAIMTMCWHWLSGVWDQQLDQGRAWTTTGRLIRIAQRIGYLCGATGVLVALQLAAWPRLLNDVRGLDNSRWRWVCGLSAIGLLTAALIGAARRTRKPTLAYLALFAVLAGVIFSLVRLGDSRIVQLWSWYWPLLMPPIAGICLVLAIAAMRSPAWSTFARPLITVGLLVLPVLGSLCTQWADRGGMPHWTLAAVLGMLALLYAATAWWLRKRIFLLTAGVCMTLALWLQF